MILELTAHSSGNSETRSYRFAALAMDTNAIASHTRASFMVLGCEMDEREVR